MSPLPSAYTGTLFSEGTEDVFIHYGFDIALSNGIVIVKNLGSNFTKKEGRRVAVLQKRYIKTYLRVLITTAEPAIATRAMIANTIMFEASPGLTGSLGLGSSTTGALTTA